MIRADLERLVPSHNESRLAILAVFQQSYITGSTLFPLVRFANELEEFCSHLERLLLKLFVGLGFDFFGETNDWFEVDVFRFWGLIL